LGGEREKERGRAGGSRTESYPSADFEEVDWKVQVKEQGDRWKGQSQESIKSKLQVRRVEMGNRASLLLHETGSNRNQEDVRVEMDNFGIRSRK
jgi:hypothetical protein